ncbi:arginyl-tRNA synthetase [Prauserella shujinwangii]|uniref:Arginine--tRNA ligase n=1 Tax=Prauserella shujinwangii TaxID=1453103 RepID=A0A2T0LYL3_9PSEU|nr:arginine--tRNA ligase [Prauserella shujinwangii]PRX49199.1 arginyl-tRNA synthetase [Prauserella shujinwangii]
MVEQVRSLVSEVEHAVSAAMAAELPAELADQDPLVRRSDHADFQSDIALALAKKADQKPRDLAERLRPHLAAVPWITAVELSGPGFLNITVADAAVVKQLAQRSEQVRLGVAESQSGQVVVVDYSAPNIAKEMHVGHLRSTLIGDALVRVLDFLGAEVVRQNHVGDWGTQFGMLIQHLFEHPGANWRNTEVDQVGNEDATSALDALYRAARAEFDADEAFKERAQRRVVALQSGDEETVAAWREIVKESEIAFQRIYDRLGVLLNHDDLAGESRYNSLLADVVEELWRKGIVEKSQDALVVFFDDIRGPSGDRVPLLVRKRDGGYGYGTTDLATIRYRLQELKATRALYVVDARQAQHFDMVFRVARRAGWLTDQDVVHVQFGTVLGSDGKPFKTRSGGTVRLADLLDDALRRAQEIVTDRNPELESAELEEIAHTASVGAVKYAELSTARTKDYAFDVDRMVSFTGATGVYLQYMHTRIKSIQRRAVDAGVGEARFVADLALKPQERALSLLLDEFAATCDAVADALEPHRLAGYLYALARTFSSFYEACPVLKAESSEIRANRLALCALTGRTMARGLDLLGISAPEKM